MVDYKVVRAIENQEEVGSQKEAYQKEVRNQDIFDNRIDIDQIQDYQNNQQIDLVVKTGLEGTDHVYKEAGNGIQDEHYDQNDEETNSTSQINRVPRNDNDRADYVKREIYFLNVQANQDRVMVQIDVV